MSWAELLEAAEAARNAATSLGARAATLPIAGVGWATVEHERAQRELDALLGPTGPWIAADRDAALGARGWRRAASRGQPPFLMILEPDTEGRLAASLARFGEGVAVVYLGMATPLGGPGSGTLIRSGPAWGPHAVLLEPLDSGLPEAVDR